MGATPRWNRCQHILYCASLSQLYGRRRSSDLRSVALHRGHRPTVAARSRNVRGTELKYPARSRAIAFGGVTPSGGVRAPRDLLRTAKSGLPPLAVVSRVAALPRPRASPSPVAIGPQVMLCCSAWPSVWTLPRQRPVWHQGTSRRWPPLE